MVKFLFLFLCVSLCNVTFGQSISPSDTIFLCPGGNRVLTATAPGGTTFQWLQGKAPPVPIPNQIGNTYTVTSPGTYWVVLGGASPRDTLGPVTVILASLPVASYTFSPNTIQCGNTPINFTSTSEAGSTNTWIFDDPNSGTNNSINTTANSVAHNFIGNPGILTQPFQVKLIVTNAAGCKDSVTHQVTINQIPKDSLVGTGQIFFEGKTYFRQCNITASLFTFTNQTLPVNNNNYEIIWGDGSANFNQATFPASLSHTYQVGNYQLQFIVTGGNGCIDTTNYGVFVGDAPNGGISSENPVLSGCTGTIFNFSFSLSVFSNAPGTTYTISVDDGSPVTVYNQPPPPSYTHIFNKASCSNGFNNNNFFTVFLNIANPCNVIGIPLTIGGMKISSTPEALFSISNDTLCVNQTSTFTDQSINNYVNESGQCTSGNSVWAITPGIAGVDWAITSGTMGSDNGNPLPSGWTTGSAFLQVRFITPGSYVVKLRTGGSDQCGIDSISENICVNPIPNANFTLSSDPICTSVTDSVKYTPAIEYCGKNTYAWVVTYTPTAGCTPSTENYTYVDGTNAGSANPHFRFLNPGIYVIQLTAYSPGKSCSAQSQVNVVVNGVPFESLPPITRICNNQSVTFADSVSCFITSATYKWTFPGSNTDSSTLQNPPPVIYPNPGSYNVILAVTNACGTSTTVAPVIVDTLVPANAGPDTTLCGSSVTMAANSTGLASGNWSEISGPSPANISVFSSPTTTITNLTAGSYIFQWKITNGGCSDSSRVTIVIVPGPTTADAGPDQQLCLTNTTNLAGNNPLTGTGRWSFVSGPNQPVIQDPLSPTSEVTGLIPGQYIFAWTISFSNCEPSTDSVTIKIRDNPTDANAGPDQTLCSSSTTLTGNTPIIGTGQWTMLSGPNTPIIASTILATTTVTGMISGTYLFIWKISNDPCPASLDTVQIIVSTIANNVIGNNQSICTNTLAATINGSVPTGGNGNYTYQWQQSLDGGTTWNNISGALNTDFSPGILATSTCYHRIVKTTLCPSGDPSGPVCITVNPNARARFSAVDTILCAPVNIDTLITVTAYPNQNLQYNWYENNIFISGNTSGQPPSYLINIPGQTVVIKLVTTSLFGCRADSMILSFRTLPSVTPNFTKNTASGCGPLSVNFINTSSITDNTIKFYWNFGNGITLSNVMQPASPAIYPASPNYKDTTYYITLQAFSGCNITIKKDSIKVFANPKSRFTSIATGCSPFRDAIINNSFGQDAFTTYYWDFGDNSTDTTLTMGTLYHTYNTGIIDTFTIRLISQNRCGRDTQYMNTVVTPNIIQPQISLNGSELYGCAPHTITFQNSSLGASLLSWDFGDGTLAEIIPNSQSVINHTYTNSGVYNIMITLQNDCTDTTITRQVTVYPPPVASFNLINTLLCEGDSVTTNNSSSNANSYEWFWGDNTNTTAYNASHFYTNPGTYSIQLVARKTNAFGTVCTDTSAVVTVAIVAPIPAIIDFSPNNQCVPYTIKVTADSASNAAKVDWYFYDSDTSQGIFHVSGSPASYLYNSAGIDSVKLIVQNNAGCSDSAVGQFPVHNTPSLLFTPYNAETCNTDTTITFTVTPQYSGTDPINYEWFINNQVAGNSNPFTYQFQVPAGITASNQYAIKVLATNSFGCGDTSLFGNFSIQTLESQHILVSPSLVQEQPYYTFTFTDTSQGLANTTYLWFPGDANGVQLPGKSITYAYGDTGTYHIQLLVQDFGTGCSDTDSVTVYVLGVPGYLYVPNAFCPGCHKAELRQFLPLGKGLKDYHLVIFNIWGQKVFETTSLDANGVPNEPWNGNWPTGTNTQEGAFSWYIEAHFINGTEWKGMFNPKTNQLEKQGFISIIR